MSAGELPGMLIGLEHPTIIFFQWNPQLINTKKKPHWHKLFPAGAEGPTYHYGAGDPDTLTITMDLSLSKGGVHYAFEQIKMLTRPLVQGIGMKRPPLSRLIMGEVGRTGFVVDVHGAYGPTFDPYTYMAHQGKVTVSFEEAKQQGM